MACWRYWWVEVWGLLAVLVTRGRQTLAVALILVGDWQVMIRRTTPPLAALDFLSLIVLKTQFYY